MLLRYRGQRSIPRIEPLIAAVESDAATTLLALSRANAKARQKTGKGVYSIAEARRRRVLSDEDILEVTQEAFDAWADSGFRVDVLEDNETLWRASQNVWQHRWTLAQATRQVAQTVDASLESHEVALAMQAARFHALGISAVLTRNAMAFGSNPSAFELAREPDRLRESVGAPEGMLTRNLLQTMGLPQPLCDAVDAERAERTLSGPKTRRTRTIMGYAKRICELEWRHRTNNEPATFSSDVFELAEKLGKDVIEPRELYAIVSAQREWALSLSEALFPEPPPLGEWIRRGYLR